MALHFRGGEPPALLATLPSPGRHMCPQGGPASDQAGALSTWHAQRAACPCLIPPAAGVSPSSSYVLTASLSATALVGGTDSEDGGVFNAPGAGLEAAGAGVGTASNHHVTRPHAAQLSHSTVNPPALDFLLRLSTWFFKVTFPSCFLARERKIMDVLSDTL